MTLLELIVVIVLMGLVLAIAAPSFGVPAAPRPSEMSRVLDAARRAAVLRGEPVTLSVGEAGAWRIDGDATSSAPPLATGTLATHAGAFRVHVSPLGTCVPDPMMPGRPADWNIVDCRPASTAREAVP